MNKINKSKNKNKYDSSSIQILEGLDAVKKRPGMYIGDISNETGLHRLIFEVVDNSIDEALVGYCDLIHVTIHKDYSISVIDNGRGIPIDIKYDDKNIPKRSAAEIVMTELHSGGKFNQNTYKVSGGLHGVGVSCVNALSKWLKLTIYRNKKKYFLEFNEGFLKNGLFVTENNYNVSKVPVICNTNKQGTKIRFLPNKKIFGELKYNHKYLIQRMKELSLLNNGLKIILTNKFLKKTNEFLFNGGIKEFITKLNKEQKVINKSIFYVIRNIKNIQVEVAMQWNESNKENVLCFTNNIPQLYGGTHLTGLRGSVTRVMNKYIIDHKMLKKEKIDISGESVRDGLACVISIRMSEPKFDSQTKNKLVSSEVRSPVEEIVSKSLDEFLLEFPNDAKNICNKIINSARIRSYIKKIKEKTKRNVIDHVILPGKLADCQEKNPKNCEIYIVEGDSAGGSAKQGRDRRFQAILPLRGKVLNVEKAQHNKILSSDQIITLFTALGYNYSNEIINLNKLRYHRIIIMTDADIDGAHIRTLLLTLFYKKIPEIIKRGYVYIAQPPLYRIKDNKREIYFRDIDELNKYILNLAVKDSELIPYKGAKSIFGKKLNNLFNNYYVAQYLISGLSKFYDPLILGILIDNNIDINLSSNDLVKDSINKLKYLFSNIKKIYLSFKTKKIFNKITNKYSIYIECCYYGNIKNIVIDDELQSKLEYKNLLKNSKKFNNLLGNDAIIKYKKLQMKVKNFKELMRWLIKNVEKNISKQRYKGLGEMNPEQLWETTMNPSARRLLKINVSDAKAASEMLSSIMGDNVSLRRSFIELNSQQAKNLDI